MRARAGRCVGAPPAGRGAGRAAGGSGPGLGRDRDRGVRAGVLRQPVRVDGAAVRALRRPAVDAGGGRPGRLARRGPRADDAGAGPVVQAGDHPDPDPGPHRDGRPDPGAGPVPGRPPAVRVPARRCRAAPEQGARRVGPAGAPAGARPGDRAGRAVDVRAAAGRAQRRADHPGAERCRGAVPVRGRPGTQPAPDRERRGRCARSRRSWPTPGTRAGRCGTGSAPTSTWSTRPTPGSGTSRCSGGTCPRAGSSPAIPRIRRWSARPTSSPPRTPPRRAARPARRRAGTCWPGCSLRAVRAAAGIGLVQRQARLPVPPRLHQRRRPGSRPAEEHLRPRGPDPAAPGRPRHPARRRLPAEPGAADQRR